MADEFSTLNVLGPYREPREQVFSYDYSVQRPNWPTPQGVRVKVSIEHELEYFKRKILQLSGGSPGQQVRINQLVGRAIADQKLEISNQEGLFLERRDVMIVPFTDTLGYLFERLDTWMEKAGGQVREDIKEKVGL